MILLLLNTTFLIKVKTAILTNLNAKILLKLLQSTCNNILSKFLQNRQNRNHGTVSMTRQQPQMDFELLTTPGLSTFDLKA